LTGPAGAGFNFVGNYRGSSYIAFSATPAGFTPSANPSFWGQIDNGVYSDSSANTAAGINALPNSPSGSSNTAFGYASLLTSATSSSNVAIGFGALEELDTTAGGAIPSTSNVGNTALGDNAGSLLASGSNNIYIGNQVEPLDGLTAGFGVESGKIRIGVKGVQQATYIQGINGVATGLAGSAVVVDGNGQLGTISSSRRYKEDIRPMAGASDRLLQLRPVQFRYKKPNANGDKPIQYGLIAEEVQDVLPELVVSNTDGQPETVAYHLLPAMLLNELQKEHGQLAAQETVIHAQASQIAKLEAEASEVDALKRRLAELERVTAVLVKLTGQDSVAVQSVSRRVVESAPIAAR
jgi:hypothetical protein